MYQKLKYNTDLQVHVSKFFFYCSGIIYFGKLISQFKMQILKQIKMV